MKFIVTGKGKGVYGSGQQGPFDGIGGPLLGHENLFRIGGEGGSSMSYNDLTDLPDLNIEDWDLAFSWGNHAEAGYLTSFTETDPIFVSSPAYYITDTQITHWNNAFGWGNHAEVGYLTSADVITITNITQIPQRSYNDLQDLPLLSISDWNTAFSWGNHAEAGYLTSFTETDPIFVASPAYGISNQDLLDWSAAHSWGNHAEEGYLTEVDLPDYEGYYEHYLGLPLSNSQVLSSDTQGNRIWIDLPTFENSGVESVTGDLVDNTDPKNPIVSSNSLNISNWDAAYSWGNHATAGYLTSYTETDPIFTASPAHGITALSISNWNTAYGWGDHSTVGYLTSADVVTITNITQIPLRSYNDLQNLPTLNISDWNTAFSWGDHSLVGYLTSFTETDPIFVSSPAYGISSLQISNWNTAFSWGDHNVMGYLTSADVVTITNITQIPQRSYNDLQDLPTLNIMNWDAAYSWGNHAEAGYLTQDDLPDYEIGIESLSGNIVDNTDPKNPIISRDGVNKVISIPASNLSSIDAAGVAEYLNTRNPPIDNSQGKNLIIEIKFSLSSSTAELGVPYTTTYTFTGIQIFSNAPKGWVVKTLYPWVEVGVTKGVGNVTTTIKLTPADKRYDYVPAIEIMDGQNTYIIYIDRF